MKKTVHVAVGVIQRDNQILIAKRANHQHQGGLWEFPGGKVEDGESVTSALIRELHEELAITATQFIPLIKVRHDYGEKVVLLDVWRVTKFDGEETGREGQPLKWIDKSRLPDYKFPAANAPIVSAVMLPNLIAITPAQGGVDSLLEFAERALKAGATALQLRAPQLSDDDFWLLHKKVKDKVDNELLIIVNSRHLMASGSDPKSNPKLAERLSKVSAVHLTSKHVKFAESLAPSGVWIMAACHNLEELDVAEQAGVHAVLVSPIAATSCHPNQQPLGWVAFADIVGRAKLPVFALGGMKAADLAKANSLHAQGIAGISLFERQLA